MNDETFLLFLFLLFYFMLIITCCCFVVFVVIVAVVVVVVTSQPTGWIQSNLPFQRMENMRQKFAVIHTYDIIWCYIVHFVYLSLWPFRSVQVSPLVRRNVTKVSFTLWWEFVFCLIIIINCKSLRFHSNVLTPALPLLLDVSGRWFVQSVPYSA